MTVMKADSRLQVDPSTACVVDAESAFNSSGLAVDWGSLQMDNAEVVCDQEKHANVEGQV